MARPLTAQEQARFGQDPARDADGNPVESGAGSAFNQTAQHLAVLARNAVDLADKAVPSERQLKDLLELVEAGTNAVANVALVKKLESAAASARKAVGDATAAGKALDQKRQEHLNKVAAEQRGHEAAMNARSLAVNAELDRRDALVRGREAAVAKDEQELKTARAQLQEQRAEIERKIEAIRAAAR
jgi:hypothetical protein